MGRAERRAVTGSEAGIGGRPEDEVAGAGLGLGQRDEEDRAQLEARIAGEPVDQPARDLPAPGAGGRRGAARAEGDDRDGRTRYRGSQMTRQKRRAPICRSVPPRSRSTVVASVALLLRQQGPAAGRPGALLPPADLEARAAGIN